MMHKEQYHRENVMACCTFLYGNYEFGEKSCWLKHINEDSTESEEFKCITYGIVLSKSTYFKLRKNSQSENVQKCKKSK